jgi:hypothetical protein
VRRFDAEVGCENDRCMALTGAGPSRWRRPLWTNFGAGVGCTSQGTTQGGSGGAREAATGGQKVREAIEDVAHRVAPMADGGGLGSREGGATSLNRWRALGDG